MYLPFFFSAEELENELIDDRVSLSDRVAALNIPLRSAGVSGEAAADEIELDQFPMVRYRPLSKSKPCIIILTVNLFLSVRRC